MKILMTLMGLEIGGAETHVVELAKELKRKGHLVTVASSGGVYENELTDFGIAHVSLPLASKSLTAITKSYFGLKKLIKKENFDIVHAHARIPAAICGRLAKKLRFKFITTAHFDFKVNSFYQKITNWGELQLAVSHDLKNYLIENYGENPDNIYVTINGIDTKKFTSVAENDGLIDELGLDVNSRKVLYVGRIDSEVAHAALRLAENAHKIAEAHPGTQVIIVGGGSAYNELTDLAAKSNIVAGYDCVITTGPRTDIAKFTALCDVFVGVSRAALEAMASKRPTVLAGAQGYMGIFDESKLNLARANNFTCRGEVIPDGDMITDDVIKLLSLDKNTLAVMGEYNHSVVEKYYSVSKMADDYIAVYNKAGARLKEKGEIIISGYYGFKNLGDDTLLRSLISALRLEKPDVKLTVLSAKPKEMQKLYGVRTINRYNLCAIKREMKKARLFINGGGNLLQDGTSAKSLLYYTSIMRLAKKRGLKLALYANGIGPLYGQKSRKRAATVIKKADFISLRDPESLKLIREIGCENLIDTIKISADPAFCKNESDPIWTKLILTREKLAPDAKYFMVSVRSGNTLDSTKTDYDDRVINELSRTITVLMEKHALFPLFVPFQAEVDDKITEKLYNSVGGGIVLRGLSAGELYGVIEGAEFAISMRLHLLIFAASCAVPMIGLSYDKKVDSFIDYIGEGHLSDIRNFTASEITDAAEKILSDKENIKERLTKKTEELKILARNDAKEAIKLISHK